MMLLLDGEKRVVVLNRPKNPPIELGGISLSTEARKKTIDHIAVPGVSSRAE